CARPAARGTGPSDEPGDERRAGAPPRAEGAVLRGGALVGSLLARAARRAAPLPAAGGRRPGLDEAGLVHDPPLRRAPGRRRPRPRRLRLGLAALRPRRPGGRPGGSAAAGRRRERPRPPPPSLTRMYWVP